MTRSTDLTLILVALWAFEALATLYWRRRARRAESALMRWGVEYIRTRGER